MSVSHHARQQRLEFLLNILSVACLVCLCCDAPHSQSEEPRQAGADYDRRLEKGVELYSQGKHAEATVFFVNLSEGTPDRKEAFLWLGNSYAKQRHHFQGLRFDSFLMDW